MPLIQRYVTTSQGAMVLTGNTLNVRQGTPYPPGIDHLNGSYISTDINLVADIGFPNGTTFNPTQSSSTAVLNIPVGSTILYAQLSWTMNDNTPNPDNPIDFILPNGNTLVLAPDLVLKQQEALHIWQAIDVTNIISNSGSGTYTVGNVPGLIIQNNSTVSSNGWYLTVLYKNEDLPYRYFNINTGLTRVSQGSPSDFNFTGFSTPTTGAVKGYLLVAESNGDLLDRAELYIGANQAASTSIGNPSIGAWNGNAPYAQISNMLPGNVLIADTNDPNIGLLDTRGNFGTYNKDPFADTAVPFARNNCDILGIDISNKLSNSQSTLFTRVTFGGTGGGMLLNQSVQVDLNSAQFGNIAKSVNRLYSDVGTTLTYTITMSNSGLADANNVVVVDTVPFGTAFVLGSVKINGVTSVNANPQSGIKLGTLVSNQGVTITFDVTASPTLPYPSNFTNKSEAGYSFIPGVGLNPVSSNNTSNNATTTLNTSLLSATKSVDKVLTFPGDVLTYTIPITNLGTTLTNTIVFVDTISSNVTLVPNSFKQDGVTIANSPNPPGVTLTNISPNNVSTITYQVVVNAIPSTNSIPDFAYIGYKYTVDPVSLISVTTGTITNTVLTTVNYADLSDISKSVDKLWTDINTTINYTISMSNTGFTTANNIVLMDTVPLGTTFIPGSVQIDGVTSINANPALPGIRLNNLGASTRTTITFSVFVSPTIPYPGTLPNVSQVTYNFNVGTIPSSYKQATSNVVSTTLSTAVLNTSKSVDKINVNLGDVLTYTIPISNIGTTVASSIIFIDTIANGLTLVSDSLKQDGVIIPGSPNSPGVGLYNVEPGVTSTVTFQATVTSRPSYDLIPNYGAVKYSYVVDPTTIPVLQVSTTTNTNTVYSYLKLADISNMNKSVNTEFADLNTTLTYNITFTNTGNLDANDVILIDTIPFGTTFVPGSVYVNGANNPTANPQIPGINLGTVSKGATYTVTFSVVVSAQPPYPNLFNNSSLLTYNYQSLTGGKIYNQTTSNTVSTDLNTAVLLATKSVDKTSANIGDILTYTVLATNIGTTTAKNVFFTDEISSGVAIISNSFMVDGVEVSGTLVSPGILLGDMAPKTSKVVTFKAKIVKPNPSGVVANTSKFNYVYTVDPSKDSVSGSVISNTVSTSINMADLSSIRKRVDKTNAMIDDILTYTISMTNTGTIAATNVLLKDVLSRGAEFVPSSVTINGVPMPNMNPIEPGVNIGTVLPGQNIIVTFKAKVIAILPPPCEIINVANVKYIYISGNTKISTSAKSNTTVTDLASTQISNRW